MGFLSSLVSSGLDFLSGLGQTAVSNYYSDKAYSRASADAWDRSLWQYRFQAQEAKKQRDWEERMSNTAHQREVADLRSAGLNPVLSATGGSGASTPSGSMANVSVSSPDYSLLGGGKNVKGFDNLVQKYYQRRQIDSDIKLMDANARTAEQTVKEKEANVANIKANTAQVEIDSALKFLELERLRDLKSRYPLSYTENGSRTSGMFQDAKRTAEGFLNNSIDLIKEGVERFNASADDRDHVIHLEDGKAMKPVIVPVRMKRENPSSKVDTSKKKRRHN